MSKELEALEKIDLKLNYTLVDDEGYSFKHKVSNDCEEEFAITRQGLKALELIRERFGSFILMATECDLKTSKEERELLEEVLKNGN